MDTKLPRPLSLLLEGVVEEGEGLHEVESTSIGTANTKLKFLSNSSCVILIHFCLLLISSILHASSVIKYV